MVKNNKEQLAPFGAIGGLEFVAEGDKGFDVGDCGGKGTGFERVTGHGCGCRQGGCGTWGTGSRTEYI